MLSEIKKNIKPKGELNLKRILSIIAVSVLLCSLLSGCSFLKKETDEPVPEGTYFKLNKLPDIGEYKSDEIKHFFYKGGAERVFEPTKEYKGVVPYCSSSAEFKTKNDEEKINYDIYGLATTDGRIITDGIYANVNSISSSDGRTLYVCERLTSEEKQTFDIISADGSFMINAKGNNPVTPFLGLPCECFTVADDEGIKLYDFKGRLIADMTKAFGADCYFEIYYCDGEKIIFSPMTEMYESGSKLDYFCINKEGELLYTLDFGKYYPRSFQGGCLIIANDKDKKKLSDVLGNVLTGKKSYSDIIYDKQGKSFWCFDEKNEVLEKLDASGKVLLKKSTKGIGNPEWSLLSSSVESSILVRGDEKMLWFSAETGKKIKLDTSDATDIGDISDEKYDYIAAYYEDYADIYDASGTYITTIKGIAEYQGMSNGKIAYTDSENRLCIKSLKSKTGAFKIKLGKNPYWVGDFGKDTITIYSYNDYSKNAVWNIETQQVIAENMKDMVLVRSGGQLFITGRISDEYVLINQNGEKLISLSDKTLI